MTKSKWSFDWFFRKLCLEVPLIGKPLVKYHRSHGWFQRFIKFGFSGTFIYWVVRAPITWWVTEYVNIHYLVSTFLVGLALTFIWFGLSEGWVWKGKEEVKK